jgi:hypothetical protein
MASPDSDDMDDDMKAAIAMSLAPDGGVTPTVDLTADTTAPTLGIHGLDRKKMEEQRLARAAGHKRIRSISPPPTRAKKALKLEENSIAMPSGARLTSLSTPVPHVGSPPAGAALQYPNGAVKKTWAFGHERTGNEIKLEEVLEPQSLRTAVLSAYQWDVEWVLSKLKTPLRGGSTKCIFVMQAKSPEDKEKWRADAEYMSHFLRLCFPSMTGLINCMHSKLMLLFHPNKLRIAVPTANLLNFDWGETGQMENSVFLIDLPRLPQKSTVEDLPVFGQELLFFLEKQGLDQDVRDGVLRFDFSATKRMAFVHTVGGVHYRNDAARTGLLGLSRAVNHLALQADKLEIDFAASSIGQLNDSFLRGFHSAARGVDLIAEAKEAKDQAGNDFFKKGKKTELFPNIRENLRIYFPTQETVRSSTAGAAGTICLQRKYFEGKAFPRECFRDYKSTRAGLLSHNKILCARGRRSAWLYVGSSNMSKSAWGELPAARTEVKITCRNWECGVVLPVSAEKLPSPAAVAGKAPPGRVRAHDEHGDSETDSDEDEIVAGPGACQDVIAMEVFQDLVDLPFQVPGAEYDGREPWYFTEKKG